MIRAATAGDAAAIARVQVRGWLHAYSGFVEPRRLAEQTVERREPVWRELLRDHAAAGRTWVWDEGGTVAAFAAAGPARDAGAGAQTGELYAIYVDPPAQGAGVGTAMLRRAEGWLAEAGFVRAVLWTFEANAQARAFYERFGWRLDEAAPPAPAEWWAPAVRYRRELVAP
ncbi:MAG TPA: GNAT family N-acetyltransferase [Solirubrobacteraceae bacterium]